MTTATLHSQARPWRALEPPLTGVEMRGAQLILEGSLPCVGVRGRASPPALLFFPFAPHDDPLVLQEGG